MTVHEKERETETDLSEQVVDLYHGAMHTWQSAKALTDLSEQWLPHEMSRPLRTCFRDGAKSVRMLLEENELERSKKTTLLSEKNIYSSPPIEAELSLFLANESKTGTDR